MSWQDRLRPGITLTSPDGTAFTASWKGNDVTGAIRVGEFSVPLVDGTIAQPLGSNSLSFPLTLYFEGPDNDVSAMAFLRALVTSRGTWTVVHPLYGTLTLQPLGNPSLSAEPVDSGNVTKVETTWIEITTATAAISTAELGGQLSAQVDTALASSGAQFASALNTADAEAQAAAAVTGSAGLGAVYASGLGPILRGASDIQAAVATAYAGVQNALVAVPMDAINAVANVQALLQLPALGVADVGAKITAFSDFATRMAASVVPGADADSRNSAVMAELWLTGALCGAALAVTVTSPATRDSAVQTINSLSALFASVTASLDSFQQASAGNPAYAQYFSATGMWADLARMIGLAAAYLLRLTFDLKIARRFTLTRPRACIEIVITEYGSLGDGDANLDLFIASNGLRGSETQLLSAGREVVVYV